MKALNLYSTQDVLKAISDTLEEAAPGQKWMVSNKYTDIRILLGLVACGIATYGHFGLKFPADLGLLGVCVLAYFLLSGVLFLWDYFVLKRSCLVLKQSASESYFIDLWMESGSSDVRFAIRSSKTCKDILSEATIALPKLFYSSGEVRSSDLIREVGNLLKQAKGGKAN